MKAKVQKIFLQKIVITLFFIIFFMSYIKVLPYSVCNFYYGFTMIFLMISCAKKINSNIVLLLVCVLAVVCGVVSGIYTGILEISVYFKTVIYILMGYYCSKVVLYYKPIFWFYEIILAYLVFASGLNLNLIFSTLSRNYISVFSMMATIMFYLGEEKRGNEVKLYPGIINFVLCVGAIGRGGILSSAFLLLSVIFLKYFISVRGYKRLLFLSFAVLILLIITITPSILKRYSVLFARFADYGIESSGRTEILKEYFEQIISSPTNLFFGCRVNNCPSILRFNLNLHNTFLQMHFTYGIIFSLVVILLSVKACKNAWSNGSQLFVMLFITYIIRSMVDQIGYAFFGEIFIYYFIIQGLDYSKISNNTKNILKIGNIVF